MASNASVLPVIFMSHGGGPAWYLDGRKEGIPMLKDMDMYSKAADVMRNFRSVAGLPRSPRAILVVSAHWEEVEHTVLTSHRPQLYFDYYGFPEFTYKLEWPVAGEPSVAQAVVQLLASNGIKCCENSTRGLDHGVFVPLKLAYPEADVPGNAMKLQARNRIPSYSHERY